MTAWRTLWRISRAMGTKAEDRFARHLLDHSVSLLRPYSLGAEPWMEMLGMELDRLEASSRQFSKDHDRNRINADCRRALDLIQAIKGEGLFERGK